jgi:PKD domain/Divergent InlB B-repeat domain
LAKKYLVYYDGAVNAGACGVAPAVPTRGGTQRAAIVFLNMIGGCGTLGDANWLAITAAHELIHTLGAVLSGAPHLCAVGHVCDDARDVMYAGDEDTVYLLADRILDVGRDDYYSHSGSWWDVQDSLWLVQNGVEQSRLDVRVEGAAGKVTSDPAGIDCAGECAFLFNDDAVVTLQASPLAGTRFRHWEGACTGSSSACRVTLDASKTVVARFAPPNTPPTASFSVVGPHRPLSPITFTSTSSDDGSIANAFWSFGDATIATGLSVTHAFARSGAYTVRLTVVDDEGAQSSIERTVTIVDSRPSATASSRSAHRGALLRLPFRASDDVQLRRANVQIFAGSRRLASTTRTIGTASYSGYVTWRAPKRRAALRWCVRAWDSAGQSSQVSCARLRIR